MSRFSLSDDPCQERDFHKYQTIPREYALLRRITTRLRRPRVKAGTSGSDIRSHPSSCCALCGSLLFHPLKARISAYRATTSVTPLRRSIQSQGATHGRAASQDRVIPIAKIVEALRQKVARPTNFSASFCLAPRRPLKHERPDFAVAVVQRIVPEWLFYLKHGLSWFA